MKHHHPNPAMRSLYRRLRWERRLDAVVTPFRRLYCCLFGHKWIVKMGGTYCAHGCHENAR